MDAGFAALMAILAGLWIVAVVAEITEQLAARRWRKLRKQRPYLIGDDE